LFPRDRDGIERQLAGPIAVRAVVENRPRVAPRPFSRLSARLDPPPSESRWCECSALRGSSPHLSRSKAASIRPLRSPFRAVLARRPGAPSSAHRVPIPLCSLLSALCSLLSALCSLQRRG
jgi:hypothetical protein